MRLWNIYDSDLNNEASQTYQIKQCVGEDIITLEYNNWNEYPYSINWSGKYQKCNSVGENSVETSCQWSTPNPILSLVFPDDLSISNIGSSDDLYMILRYFDSSDCQSDSMIANIGIVYNKCFADDDGVYRILNYDGKFNRSIKI